MKCTAKVFLEHYNEIPVLGVGFICHVHVTSSTYLCQAFPDAKYVKKYQYEERYPTGRYISWPSLVLHPAG